jgi:hypothetical protein
MSDSDGKQISAATTTTDTSPSSSNDDVKLGSSDNEENVKVDEKMKKTSNGTYNVCVYILYLFLSFISYIFFSRTHLHTPHMYTYMYTGPHI